MLLQTVQRLESEMEDMKKQNDKLEGEKASNIQRIKLLEHEINKIKKMEANTSEKDGYLLKIQSEYEEMKITNTVYFDKIGELVDRNNELEDEIESKSREWQAVIDKLGKQLKDNGIAYDAKQHGYSDNMTVKGSVTKGNHLPSDDVHTLRKEVDGLRQKIVDLTDKNMDLQNKLHDVIRGKSATKTTKKP